MTPVLFKCSKCREHKPATGFHKDRRKVRGLASACMDCNREQQRQNSARQHQKQKERYSAMIGQLKPKLIGERGRPRNPLQRVQKPKPDQTTPKPPKPPRKPQNSKKPALRKTKLKPVSKKRDVQNRKYLDLRRKFLRENPNCQFRGCREWSTQCHHMRGREGPWLTDVTEFMACCAKHHTWIEDNREAAFEMGYLKLRLTTDQIEQQNGS